MAFPTLHLRKSLFQTTVFSQSRQRTINYAEPGSKLIKRWKNPNYNLRSPQDREVVDVSYKTVTKQSSTQSMLEDFAASVETNEPEMELLEGPLPGRFRSFHFHNQVEVLVAEDGLNRLNLAKSYLYDGEAKIYAKPFFGSDIPNAYRYYLVHEWDTWISGDVAFDEEERTELEKVYFIGQLLLKGNQFYRHVDIEEVYCINSATRRVERAKIDDRRDAQTTDPVLRIFEDEVVIMDSRDCPTKEDIAVSEEVKERIETRRKALDEIPGFDRDSTLEEAFDQEDTMEEELDAPKVDM